LLLIVDFLLSRIELTSHPAFPFLSYTNPFGFKGLSFTSGRNFSDLCFVDLILGKRGERLESGEPKSMESSGDPWIGVLVCFSTGDLN
jgi:hypothetical protein